MSRENYVFPLGPLKRILFRFEPQIMPIFADLGNRCEVIIQLLSHIAAEWTYPRLQEDADEINTHLSLNRWDLLNDDRFCMPPK